MIKTTAISKLEQLNLNIYKLSELSVTLIYLKEYVKFRDFNFDEVLFDKNVEYLNLFYHEIVYDFNKC
jgi:hypothetical protein